MFKNYLKIALRSLSKNRAFASLNTLGLGLGIGACVLIFMIVRLHLTYDHFHKDIDRIGIVGTESRLETSEREANVPYPMGEALRAEYAFLEKTAMISSRSGSLITVARPGEAPAKFMEEEARAFAEPEFFDIFDFPLVAGSMAEFSQPKTAVLTEKLARKYFGTTDALGRSFQVNNKFEYRVVGVLKDFPDNTDFQARLFTSWATLKSDSNSQRMLRNWGGIHGGTQCFFKMREGHQLAELEAAFPAFKEKYFHLEVREFNYHAAPMAAAHFDADYGFGLDKRLIWALALIGVFLLGTACVNFVNMATAQALGRAREVGVRKAMGSTRGQLFWQFMAETGMIVLFSMAFGLLLARLALPALNRLARCEMVFDFQKDLGLYAFLAGLAAAVAFLAGAYPGLVVSAFRPVWSLKTGTGGQLPSSAGGGGFSVRRWLVGTQFGITQLLIIAAVVVTAQLEYARRADLGFRKEGIVNVVLPAPQAEKKALFRQKMAEIPGIQRVSICMQPPASESNWQTRVRRDDRAEPEQTTVNIKAVDESYLPTFDLKLLAGRNLEPSDTLREYVVNEQMVKLLGFASPQEAIGRRIDLDHNVFPIVGVVKDFHNKSFRSAIQPLAMGCNLDNSGQAALRIDLAAAKPAMAEVEKAWEKIYPEYVFDSEWMDVSIANFYEMESALMRLARVFAGIAVFIGCLGLYGLAAFLVNRKQREIGIRKVLGAGVAGILWLFGREYSRLILAAFAVAAPLSFWLMNGWLAGFAYRISLGAWVFGVALGATFLVAAATVGFQSIRAAMAEPAKSLRSE